MLHGAARSSSSRVSPLVSCFQVDVHLRCSPRTFDGEHSIIIPPAHGWVGWRRTRGHQSSSLCGCRLQWLHYDILVHDGALLCLLGKNTVFPSRRSVSVNHVCPTPLPKPSSSR